MKQRSLFANIVDCTQEAKQRWKQMPGVHLVIIDPFVLSSANDH